MCPSGDNSNQASVAMSKSGMFHQRCISSNVVSISPSIAISCAWIIRRVASMSSIVGCRTTKPCGSISLVIIVSHSLLFSIQPKINVLHINPYRYDTSRLYGVFLSVALQSARALGIALSDTKDEDTDRNADDAGEQERPGIAPYLG